MGFLGLGILAKKSAFWFQSPQASQEVDQALRAAQGALASYKASSRSGLGFLRSFGQITFSSAMGYTMDITLGFLFLKDFWGR